MATNDHAVTGPAEPSRPGRLRNNLLTAALITPTGLWYLFLLVAPLIIVFIFSFGTRAKNGGYAPAFVFDNYTRALSKPAPFLDSLWMSAFGTIACLLVAYPLAYFIATRARKRKSLLILLLVVPFWTSFLIRTYAWLLILSPGIGIGAWIGTLFGTERVDLLGTPLAVLIGLVYGYLPLMVFPLYVTLERMDRTLIEASKDLGAGRWATFRQITLPVTLPGLVTGSILVFIPMMGEYVIPQLLGLGRTYLMGNALVTDFLEARNWPSGAARAVLLIVIMMVTVSAYVFFVNRGRKTRDVSVL